MAKTYAQKLKDPRWQRKRLEVLDVYDWACSMCGDTESTLHVHHKQYIRGREPWDYDVGQLAVLCESCHKDHHEDEDRLNDVTSRLPMDGQKWVDREKAACLLAGIMGLDDFKIKNMEQKAWFYVGLYIQHQVDELYESYRNDAKAEGK